jgi:hypothetical protein
VAAGGAAGAADAAPSGTSRVPVANATTGTHTRARKVATTAPVDYYLSFER